MNIAAGAIFSPNRPAKPGYEIAVQEHGAEQKGAADGAAADRGAAGQSEPRARAIVRQGLHRLPLFEKGGPNKLGPHLWGIVNRPRASEPGFNYSAAMKAKGGNWSFEELDKFLANPKGYIPGTAMGFTGMSRDTQRADVINYLHTLADKPVDLPKAAAK